MLRQVIRLTQPASEPITLSEAKDSLRIPSGQTIDDDYITGLISSARDQAEQFIDMPICQAEFVIVYDFINSIRFILGYPASAVSSVTYRDADAIEQVASFTYDAQLNELFFDETISGTSVKITITGGQASGYPESLKRGILMILGDLYTGRTSAEFINKAAQMMLMPFKNRPIV
jgi:uncharacterized phiE125 gp8 family phage protein